jgi:hypothetical protein
MLKERLKTAYAIFKDRTYLKSFGLAFLFLFLSFVINYYASIYATQSISNSVADIVLSNIPVYNVAAIFLFGPLVYWLIFSVYMLWNPATIPFALKSIALFVVVRSLFISLTHLGPFPDEVSLAAATNRLSDLWDVHANPNFLAFGSGGDLFFSGHTGLPFLMSLIFWTNKRLRVFGVITAVFFGVIVLLGHLHYTIDVLSAFFITYGVFHISGRIFKKDAAVSVDAMHSASVVQ